MLGQQSGCLVMPRSFVAQTLRLEGFTGFRTTHGTQTNTQTNSGHVAGTNGNVIRSPGRQRSGAVSRGALRWSGQLELPLPTNSARHIDLTCHFLPNPTNSISRTSPALSSISSICSYNPHAQTVRYGCTLHCSQLLGCPSMPRLRHHLTCSCSSRAKWPRRKLRVAT
jgi:hypothetical protein